MQIIGQIVNGQLDYDEEQVNKWVSKQKENYRYLIDITRLDNNVANMMRYYRSTVLPNIANYRGETEYCQHELILTQFGLRIVDGEEEYALRTRYYNKAQWTKFLDQVIKFYTMEGAPIPPAKTEDEPY